MDVAMMERVFATVASHQKRYDAAQHPNKLRAKARAVALVTERLAAGARVLDVGGEEFYQAPLRAHCDVMTLNLPDDMHDMRYDGQFEGALAMHVLEHSPAPLYVLALLHRALVPGGWLYVAVPKPCAKFCRGYGHMSVLPHRMWLALLDYAGFQVIHAEEGSFGWRKRWVEFRFLAERRP